VSSKRRELRVVISGGGTGGHIFPAIAIANALREANASTELLFVGASGRMEMEKVPAAGYRIVGLPVTGIRRSLSPRNLLVPFRALVSVIRAGGILRTFRPDIAVGVGGYASGPLLLAAALRRIPCLIQEQNSHAGVTNKVLSRMVQRICVAYEGMERYFPREKIVMTGNPVRQDILQAAGRREEGSAFFGLDPARPVVLVLGGSLGARTINESIHAGLGRFADAGIQLVWQTGKAYAGTAAAAVSGLNRPGLSAYGFIQRMDLAYAVADVVVSRAGASSVSELCLAGKPSILVPSPNVAEDHQTRNAMALVARDAAVLVSDHQAREQLVDEALRLVRDEARRTALQEQISAMALPGAAGKIVDEIYSLVKTRHEPERR
jgi:UDP-N-acetylglucosamine--N-acetylmuramyl-(pentapeptide) pyrophosphoryl-undecaprenol N-acetylglucosamine transferase